MDNTTTQFPTVNDPATAELVLGFLGLCEDATTLGHTAMLAEYLVPSGRALLRSFVEAQIEGIPLLAMPGEEAQAAAAAEATALRLAAVEARWAREAR